MATFTAQQHLSPTELLAPAALARIARMELVARQVMDGYVQGMHRSPHIGFALELVQADIVARYRALLGDEVFFNTGTDEHGLKIYRKAQEEGKDPPRRICRLFI